MSPHVADRGSHREDGYEVALDPRLADAYLHALYERGSSLAARVDDWLDLLEEDPFAEAVVRRARILTDANGRHFSVASVRTGDEEAVVGWRVEGRVVHVILIADNTVI